MWWGSEKLRANWIKGQEQIETMKKDKQVSCRRRRKASAVAELNETKEKSSVS